MSYRRFGQVTRFFLLTSLSFLLAACGGGGGSDSGFLGGGGENADLWQISVGVTDQDGNAINELEEGAQATVTVTVADGNNAVANEVVTLEGTLITVSPEGGSVSTSADGTAVFTITAGSTSGAGSVIASANSPGGAVSARANFNIVSDTWSVAVALQSEAGNPVTAIDPLSPGRAVVTVTNQNGEPVSDAIVSASTNIATLLPTSGTAVSDADGMAYFLVQSSDTSGADTLTITVDQDDVTSYTETLNFTVDTDLPFKISARTLNLAGDVTTSIESSQDILLEVSVLNQDTEEPIASQTVQASIGDLGSILPTSGLQLTDENGIATFEIKVGTQTGAFPIDVSAVIASFSVNNQILVSVAQAERALGYFDDNGDFVSGVIKVEPAKQLSPTGTAALTIAIVDGSESRTDSEESITLTSECLFSGQATLDPASPVAATSQITVNYTANGCSGADEITARLASTGATATGTVEIATLSAEVISFESATPEVIALRNTGSTSNLRETSAVAFKVTDRDGNPVSDVKVNFTLSTTIGGVALNCQSDAFCNYADATAQTQSRSTTGTDRTDLDGFATAELLAGTIATPVRVIAYIDSNENNVRDEDEPQTTSANLVITTGIPDQNSVSLSAAPLNVEGAYDSDGHESVITVRMADHFNNPVPDGTQVVFTTEYGVIQGSCVTEGGLCSVTWTSQDPRSSAYADAITIYNDARYSCPSHSVKRNGVAGGACPDDLGVPRGGRSTILAYAIGEESFVDANGNGLYDEGEFWTNLPEAFRDENEDGYFTPNKLAATCTDPNNATDDCLSGFAEEFIDFNENGAYNTNTQPPAPVGSPLPDGLFNGVLCREEDAATGICSRELVNVRDSLVIVNSFSDAGAFDIALVHPTTKTEPSAVDDGINYLLYVADIFNNPPPPGTEISFEGSGRCDVLTPTPTIGDTSRPGAYATSLSVSTADGEDPTPDPDLISILVTLPSGSVTVRTFNCIVQDPAPVTTP